MQITVTRGMVLLLEITIVSTQGCNRPVPAELDVENLPLISSAFNVQKKSAWTHFGKGESVLIFQIEQPLKGEATVGFFTSQLLKRGWQPCTASSLGRWGTYEDATRKGEVETILQYRGAFKRETGFAELLVNQTVKALNSDNKGYLQTVMVRLTTEKIGVC